MEAVLTDILELALNRDEACAIAQGQSLTRENLLQRLPKTSEGTLLKATFEGKLIAFVVVKENKISPTKVFNQDIKGENDVD